MTLNSLKFNGSLIALLIYELAMLIFVPDGLSLFKLILTGLVWVSFFIACIDFFKRYKALQKRIPSFAFYTIIALLFWNFINIFRSIATGDGTITTLFGNVFTALALLLPMVITFSTRKQNLSEIHRFFFNMLKIGIPIFLVFFIATGGHPETTQVRILLLLFTPITFMITIMPFFKKRNNLFVLIGALILTFAASLYGQRTMFIRELSLVLSLFAVYLYNAHQWKWVLVVGYATLLFPFVLLQQSIVRGESVFEEYLSRSLDSDLKTDTRTFLYQELFEDLAENNQLLIGKGANGSYYSEYFSQADEESEYRNNIEVGVLGMMLKGGGIALLLNLLVLFIAIFYAFFRSRNTYVVAIGFILIAHTILLFIENYYRYSSDNYFVWFFIGVCLSKEIRQMSNQDMIVLLHSKKLR